MSSIDDLFSHHSAFLSLPTELRCHIYDYLLADRQSITIAAGYITGLGDRIKDRARNADIPGLPLDLVPLVRSHHDPALLSIANPPTIAIEHDWVGDYEGGKIPDSAPFALLQTCKLVKEEMLDYMNAKKRVAPKETKSRTIPLPDSEEEADEDAEQEGLSLHVTYPHGVLVLKNLYPSLLKQARRLYLYGYHTSPGNAEPGSPVSPSDSEDEAKGESSSPSGSFVSNQGSVHSSMYQQDTRHDLRSRMSTSVLNSNPFNRLRGHLLRLNTIAHRAREHERCRFATTFPPLSPSTTIHATTALAHLVRTVFAPEASQDMKLKARFVFPGENSYTSVWADDKSPVTPILRNVCGGRIGILCQRGNPATGLIITVSPNPQSRVISTSWRTWHLPSPPRNGAARRLVSRHTRMTAEHLDEFVTNEKNKWRIEEESR